MNDSISVSSSSYSSSTNSNSNSLNRSLIANSNYLLMPSVSTSSSSSTSSASSTTSTTNMNSSMVTTATMSANKNNHNHNVNNNNNNNNNNNMSSNHNQQQQQDSLLMGCTNNHLIHNNSASNTSLIDKHFLMRYNTIEDYLLNIPTPQQTMMMMSSPIRRRRSKSQSLLYVGHLNDLNDLNGGLQYDYNKPLMDELVSLKKQLKEKDEIIEKLNDIRNKLESEMQDLSASLFEEAYLMVNTARAEAAQSEKLLKEANGKIDVLQAEVKALKELVLSSAPNTPNKHLHPYSPSNTSSLYNIQQKSGSHSRQSSLNQQQMNNLVTMSHNGNPMPPSTATATSTPSGSNSGSHNSLNTLGLASSLNNKNTSANNSTSNVKETKSSFFHKSHKRIASDLPPQAPKSFIDKLFQSSNSSLNSSGHKSKDKDKDNKDRERGRDKNRDSERERDSSSFSDPNNTNLHSPLNNSDSQLIETFEFDPIFYKQLSEWKQKPELDINGSFLSRIYSEEILPCLSFNNKRLSAELLSSIQSNSVCIEDLTNTTNQPVDSSLTQVCGLTSIPSVCQYKIKFSENGSWVYISKLTRNKVISVCDFFTYLRYIKDGLVKSDLNEIYWNIIDLRKKMSLSRLGL